MSISNNGLTCEEMYEQPCEPCLQAVRDGCAVYECVRCGAMSLFSSYAEEGGAA